MQKSCNARATHVFSELSSASFERLVGIYVCVFGTFATMPRRQRLSHVDQGRAIEWLKEGVGVREVGRRLTWTHSVIQTLRDRYNQTGSVAERR